MLAVLHDVRLNDISLRLINTNQQNSDIEPANTPSHFLVQLIVTFMSLGRVRLAVLVVRVVFLAARSPLVLRWTYVAPVTRIS